MKFSNYRTRNIELKIGEIELFYLRIWDHVLITIFLQFVVVKNIIYRCFECPQNWAWLIKNQQKVPEKGAD